MFEEDSFWLQTNYVENMNNPFLTIEAPKYLKTETLVNVIDWLITSEDSKAQIKKANELDIIGKVRNYMATHAKDKKGERVTLGLQVHLKDRDGSWAKEGRKEKIANLGMYVNPYVLTQTKDIDGKDIEIEVLEILFTQITKIGNKYK